MPKAKNTKPKVKKVYNKKTIAKKSSKEEKQVQKKVVVEEKRQIVVEEQKKMQPMPVYVSYQTYKTKRKPEFDNIEFQVKQDEQHPNADPRTGEYKYLVPEDPVSVKHSFFKKQETQLRKEYGIEQPLSTKITTQIWKNITALKMKKLVNRFEFDLGIFYSQAEEYEEKGYFTFPDGQKSFEKHPVIGKIECKCVNSEFDDCPRCNYYYCLSCYVWVNCEDCGIDSCQNCKSTCDRCKLFACDDCRPLGCSRVYGGGFCSPCYAQMEREYYDEEGQSDSQKSSSENEEQSSENEEQSSQKEKSKTQQ